MWSMAEVNRRVIVHALEQSQVRGGERGKQLTLRVLREKLSVASKAPSKLACSCVQSSPVPFPLVENCRTRDLRAALTDICHAVPSFCRTSSRCSLVYGWLMFLLLHSVPNLVAHCDSSTATSSEPSSSRLVCQDHNFITKEKRKNLRFPSVRSLGAFFFFFFLGKISFLIFKVL